MWRLVLGLVLPLAMARGVAFAGVRLPGMVCNGRYEGPPLRLKPGEMLRIHLVNRLTGPTNLHFHGIEAAPRGRGDTVAILGPPGASFDCAVPIPSDQPPGLFRYHAHVHGTSQAQVMGGWSGALVVGGLEQAAPHRAGLRARITLYRT